MRWGKSFVRFFLEHYRNCRVRLPQEVRELAPCCRMRWGKSFVRFFLEHYRNCRVRLPQEVRELVPCRRMRWVESFLDFWLERCRKGHKCCRNAHANCGHNLGFIAAQIVFF